MDERAIVTLDGSQSSVPPGGSILYGWRQLAGPLVTLDHSDPAHPIFHVPEVSNGGAILTFELGRVDELFDADPCCDKMNQCQKGMAQFLIARGNASKLFEFVEEPFDLLA